MILPWNLRRRMMMAAVASVDIANLLIHGSCTFTDYGIVTMGDDKGYRLLAITQSGNLVFSAPVKLEVCVVGGGANGFEGNWAPGYGGAGAYMKNQVIEEFESGEVVVGAAQGVSSIAGVSVAAVSKSNGGTGGGGFYNTNGGTGDGLSKYPFGDTSYELWRNKPHCAGGGGAGHTVKADENDYPDGAWYLYDGGNGGSNGSNGSNAKYDGLSTFNSANGGSGGLYGGGHGQGDGVPGSGSSSNATYYGSGGGSTKSGYQGIIYARIPVEQ